MDNEFSVYWWDRDNGQHKELRFVTSDAAVKAAHRLTHGPAAVLGIVQRVIITNGGDRIVFEWKHKEGQTWPRKEGTRQ